MTQMIRHFTFALLASIPCFAAEPKDAPKDGADKKPKAEEKQPKEPVRREGSVTIDGKKIDFWNQKEEQGRVAHKRVLSTVAGERSVSFTVLLSHFDQREGGTEILQEIWAVSVHELEGDRYRFDLDSRQSLVGDKPLLVEKYHYGGMALRGNVAWLGKDACEFLTSDGKSRLDGNHSRPNWVAMHGVLAGKPAAIVAMGHPQNFRAPQAVRLHPDKPYFCFAPMVDGSFSIGPGKEYRSRYRFLVSGTGVDQEWIDSCWKEYAAGR